MERLVKEASLLLPESAGKGFHHKYSLSYIYINAASTICLFCLQVYDAAGTQLGYETNVIFVPERPVATGSIQNTPANGMGAPMGGDGCCMGGGDGCSGGGGECTVM
uniref:Uncharacterized protein n=1 Tax=Chaetoceros debilis TaxID=122233 RepID=A0A7S3Q2W2_9STRA